MKLQFRLRTLMIVVTLLAATGGCISDDDGSLEAMIARLIKVIDDKPNPLHNDYTPSVHRLIEIGRPAIGPLLPLMLDDSEITRLHTQRAIEGITMKMMSFHFGHGWDNPDSESRWLKFWDSLGHFRSEASIDDRRKSVAKWREWLDRKEPND